MSEQYYYEFIVKLSGPDNNVTAWTQATRKLAEAMGLDDVHIRLESIRPINKTTAHEKTRPTIHLRPAGIITTPCICGEVEIPITSYPGDHEGCKAFT